MRQRTGMHIILLILLVVLGYWGWQHWRKGPWKILPEIDPDPNVQFDHLLFLDEHRGFAFGHSRPEAADTMSDVNDRFRAQEAWGYATTDGGLHWQTKNASRPRLHRRR